MPPSPSRPGARARRGATAFAALLLTSLASAQLPPFMDVGYRLSWHAGGSTLEGSRLVPDPEGWIERDGQRYRVEPTRGSGGIGVQQLDVVVASGGLLVADARGFLDTAAGGGQFVASGVDVVIGDAQSLGEYWMAPARLAAMQPGITGTTRVTRGVRRFGNADLEVVSIASSRPDGYSSHTYDLASGVLLFGGTVDAQPGARITDDSGRLLEDLRGSVGYTHLAFLDVRRLDVPWLGAPTPAWIRPGTTVVYEGTRRAEFAQPSGLPPLPGDAIRVAYAFERQLGGAVVATSIVDASNPAGVPMPPTTSRRVFASNGFDGLWIPPESLARLTPGAVLDRDPFTRQDVGYGGLSGEYHVIFVRTPGEYGEFYYDRASGFLAYTRHRRQAEGVGLMVTELGYVGTR
jgi:hypothetical protein